MNRISPLIDTASGSARFLFEPPRFEPGHNHANEAGNIDAEDDWQALLAFINEYRHSPKTFRSYAAELERLCLWLIHVHRVPLSGLKRSDLAAYLEFAAHPPESWCGPSAKKFLQSGEVNPAWRPFKIDLEGETGLSPSSLQRLQKILQSMFTYLVDEGYLLGNPATARRTKGQRAARQARSAERFLQPHETLFVESVLQNELLSAEQSGDSVAYFKALRRYYVFELFLHTGLRISEPVNYTMGDIIVRGTGEQKALSLDICGKGNVEGEVRSVSFGRSFVEILKTYRQALNRAITHPSWAPIDPLPAHEEPTPLIPDITGSKAIGERQISALFAEIRSRCIDAVDNKLLTVRDPQAIEDWKRTRSTLANFTCHWMRHTHATYFLALTGDLKATQDRLGHADLATTQIYVHVLDKARQETANKFDPAKMAHLV